LSPPTGGDKNSLTSGCSWKGFNLELSVDIYNQTFNVTDPLIQVNDLKNLEKSRQL
jgi:hypothetical protein